MVKDASSQQTNSRYSLPIASNAQTLATRVFCTHALVNIYDLCNTYDKLTLNSDAFQKCKALFLSYKTKVDQAMSGANMDEASLDLAIKADKCFRNWHLFDDGGKLNEALLLEKMKSMHADRRDNEINNIVKKMDDPLFRHEMTSILDRYGVKDFDKLKANSKRGEPNKLRENLASDFALLQQSDPNNVVIKGLVPSIEAQIDKLPYVVYWIKENPEINHQLRESFDGHENKDGLTPRQEFLKFMGKILALGEDLTKKGSLSPEKIPSKSITFGRYYDDIRKAGDNPDLSDEDISRAAISAYNTAFEGCWQHKQKCNKDDHTNKNDYVHNVSRWISNLLKGRNDIAKLAFLTGQEANKYNTTTDELWINETNKKHISVDHDTDLKYHPLLPTMDDKKLFHGIWNLTLIIGGSIHNAKTDKTENTDGQINKCLVNNIAYYKAKISKAPNRNILISSAGSVALERHEPEIIQKIRSNKKPEKEKSSSMDLFQHLMMSLDYDK